MKKFPVVSWLSDCPSDRSEVGTIEAADKAAALDAVDALARQTAAELLAGGQVSRAEVVATERTFRIVTDRPAQLVFALAIDAAGVRA